MTDELAIHQLLAARAEALRTGDAKAFCATYADGAIVYLLAPPLVQPADGFREVSTLQAWLDDKGGAVHTEDRDVGVTVDGDLAVVTGLQSMGAPPDAPQQFTLWYRSTLGLRRQGGRWLVFHEHTSTPFHMDGSQRAALDLTP